MQPIGIYVHIPFCNGKCPYCDFFSISFTEEEADRYTQAVCRQLKDAAFLQRKADTLYLGGGTPSLLGTRRLTDILDTAKNSFGLERAEVTMELNPSPGSELDFSKLKEHGLNRVSVGLQSAEENELSILGRKHSPQDVVKTVNQIKQAGIRNISLDLMVGISGQTQQSLARSIDFCKALDVPHISAYLLKVEKGTPYDTIKEKLALPDEDEQSEFYLFMCNRLEQLGYRQYEVSNFSLPGKESRHNLKYWRCQEYLGIGASAHSFLDGVRFYTPRSFQDFYNGVSIRDGEGGTAEEYIMLALRLAEGVNLFEFEARFGYPFPKRYYDNALKYEKAGLLFCNSERIHFTKTGFLLSNTLTANILWD